MGVYISIRLQSELNCLLIANTSRSTIVFPSFVYDFNGLFFICSVLKPPKDASVSPSIVLQRKIDLREKISDTSLFAELVKDKLKREKVDTLLVASLGFVCNPVVPWPVCRFINTNVAHHACSIFLFAIVITCSLIDHISIVCNEGGAVRNSVFFSEEGKI